jgi:hypothetical protein
MGPPYLFGVAMSDLQTLLQILEENQIMDGRIEAIKDRLGDTHERIQMIDDNTVAFDLTQIGVDDFLLG